MELIFFALLVGLLTFWWTSAQSRETAIALSRAACKRCSVQLLDETVTLSKLKLQRNEQGQMNIARWYTFEFSTSGNNRRSGLVGLLGGKLTTMHLDLDVEELPH